MFDISYQPFIIANTMTQVWRNVVTYGADPSGKLDSTKAINNAISDGYRCGAGCNSSTINGALVYFPEGAYTINKAICIEPKYLAELFAF
jgi:polygalacturonase